MDPEISDTVTDWEPVTAGSGRAGLESLVADEFCGAVTDGVTWAFLLNGRIVGVFDGSLDALVDADFTAHRAPDPALPLLYAMRETGGEVRGQYYTQKTPLPEVHRTLSSGNFTGYVELSENVLSGDYYIVYYGGRSMNVAFVGASERLVTDDEAFDLAADEVGIYTVTAVDVDVVDLPGGASPAGDTAAASAPDSATDASDRGDADADDPDTAEAAAADADDDPDAVTFGSPSPSSDDTEATASDDAASPRRSASDDLRGDMGIGLNVGSDDEFASDADEEPDAFGADDGSMAATDDDEATAADGPLDDGDGDFGDAEISEDTGDDDTVEGTDVAVDVDSADAGHEDVAADTDEVADAETAEREPSEPSDDETDRTAADSPDGPVPEDGRGVETHGIDTEVTNGRERGSDHDEEADDLAAADAEPSPPTETADAPHDGSGETDDDAFTAERQWQEARQIPALSPEETMDADDLAAAREESAPAQDRGDTEAADGSRGSSPGTGPEPPAPTRDPADESPAADATTELTARLERALEERDDLAAQVDTLESRLDTVTGERDDLRARLDDLEAEIERLRGSTSAPTGRGGSTTEQLSPAAARDGTNLFVRYRTKSEPTLQKARTGDAPQQAVIDNLRLEYHTTFDSEAVTVAGDSYEAFLRDTVEWGFVRWVVEDLLYEIGRAGYRAELAPLFDAIPEIDRIQFNGEVPVTLVDEDGETHESRSFDLVFWDSMGDPLFVVDVDTDRHATDQGSVGSLIEGARAVGTSKGTLSGAFYVSTSFFDPDALDAVAEETKGGLLSRGSKKSFVKLSRKDGYHLCLVEARSDEFHLTVPEL